jgi:protease PrsW
MEPGNIPVAFLWAVVPAFLLLLFIWFLDRYEKEPVRLMAIALAFGAVGAPLLAFLVQMAVGAPTSITAQTIVPESQLGVVRPLVEEISRGLAILGAFWLVRHEVDDLLDGILYGAVVGIGFAMTAQFFSILATPSLGLGTTPGLWNAMVSGLNHLFYGGVIGLAVGMARRDPLARVAAFASVGVVVALLFHLVHDYLPWWVASDSSNAGSSALGSLLSDLPNVLGLLALGAIATWTVGRQAIVVATELREEVESGVVTADEFGVVTNSARRFGQLARTLLTKGDDPWRLRRRLYSLEVELAFRKHLRRSERVQLRRWLDEDHYRAQIAEARAELDRLEGVAA